MKIGILVQDITKLGGVETVSIWLAEQLGRNNEVDIISCKKENKTSYNDTENIHIEYLSIPIEHKYFTTPDFETLKILLKKKCYDYVIVQLSTAFKNLCFVANSKLYKVISKFSHVYICIHGSPKYFITRYNTSNDNWCKFFIKKIYHFIRYRTEIKRYFRKSKKYVESFITLSKGCHDELKKYYGLDSIIRYNPYCFDNQLIPFECKKNVILWAGRLSPEKNVILLLKSWQKVSNKLDWTLKIIGSGSQEKKLKDFVLNNSIQNIELLPAVSHAELMSEFKESKIFVLTSFFEGFPTVICEAMNYKNAVISTRYDGYSDELLNNTTGFISSFDSGELTEIIEKLISNEHLLKKFQETGYENCKSKYQNLLLNSKFYFEK